MNAAERIASGALQARLLRVTSLLAGILLAFSITAAAQTRESGTVISAAQAAKLVPGAVFFRGQSANTQARNSAGVHFADGPYALAVLVDNSGYTSSVQQKYQGYLLTEVALQFGGHRLAPGAYGFGFVKDSFVVMDIGAHDLLQVPAEHDEQMHRPTPLQVLAAPEAGVYRLCSGRDCVSFRRGH